MSKAIVVMGVSGSGKSTLGQALAAALGWPFVEGDSLHPPANIAKMAAGTPLNDADRQPFLENVARAIVARPEGVVVSCSALKRVYRDLIRSIAGDVTFVLPTLTREQLQARMEQRSNHFMPAALLESQLRTLEMPGADEDAIQVEGQLPVDEQVKKVVGSVRACVTSRA
jgi:carbohydrate kinase (thermoresistant glucokinase family)